MPRGTQVAVIGAGDASDELRRLAFDVGHELASRGAVLVCGGLGGVMEAAAEGARANGGHTIGILPSYHVNHANRHIEFAIATGMGEARNAVVVASAQAVIALEGEAGTLSEIALALKLRRPVVALDSWKQIDGLHRAASAAEAVEMAFKLAQQQVHT